MRRYAVHEACCAVELFAHPMTDPQPNSSLAQEQRGSRPWLAALLSVLSPGLGHIYAGHVRRGITVFLSVLVSGGVLLFAMVRAPWPPLNVMFPVVGLLALLVFVATDAWQSARRPAAWRPRGFLGLLLVVVSAVVAGTLTDSLTAAFSARVAKAYRIPTGSMAPTLLPGDYLFAAPVGAESLRRDQVVVFHRDDRSFVSRIAGLPGDTLAMRAGTLIRNGEPVKEPYAHLGQIPDSLVVASADDFGWQQQYLLATETTAFAPTRRTWGPIVVPHDSVFALGDNRDDSFDSRYTGFLPISRVNRYPARIYFSWDRERRRLRWSRVGRDVN